MALEVLVMIVTFVLLMDFLLSRTDGFAPEFALVLILERMPTVLAPKNSRSEPK